MKRLLKNKSTAFVFTCFAFAGCVVPTVVQHTKVKTLPVAYNNSIDTINTAEVKWREFFSDSNLVALIDTAIQNNPEVLMTLQQIEVAKNKVKVAHGRFFPMVSAKLGMGFDKVGRYTSEGAGNASTEMTPGKLVPDPLSDFVLGFQSSWEADIWGKLHKYKKAAYAKYLGSIEGKNFVITNLVAEIANSYYELIALDNQLEIIRQTIQLQQNELEIVKVQKQAAVVTELAVKQFEAQVYNSQSMEFEVLQSIAENENKINFLCGRFPQNIKRDTTLLTAKTLTPINIGLPAQLLKNRPDIKQAELELVSAKCDVLAARAEFFPSLGFSAGFGFNAFKPIYLFTAPASLLYSLAGELISPLINRNAIKAEFNSANALQLDAMYNYQKTILNGYAEVATELSNISNLEKFYSIKSKQVDALTKSIEVASDLFKSARANYLEVLMAQRDALESKLELVDARKRQFNAVANIYKSLGGGWR